ncbi:UNVERIFIED_CONTAM: lytic transglycosylase domain-containing protein [Prevotella sp. 15_C9]
MMRIFRSTIIAILMIFIPQFVEAADTEVANSGFNWTPVLNAIIQVESKGNARAVNGPHVGILQISPILVSECNRILRKRGKKKRFSLSDRFSPSKSREMFLLIQSVYNPGNNVERAIRLWNGGVRYSIRKTQGYFNKVMSFL